jgi:hypothetical protein
MSALRSLLDMLKSYGSDFASLGADLGVIYKEFELNRFSSNEINSDILTNRDSLLAWINNISKHCKELDLPITLSLANDAITNLPRTQEELSMFVKVLFKELDNRQFLFITPDRAKYYDIKLRDMLVQSFPTAAQELVNSGNSLAVGLYTSSVFHAMRAAEIGVRVLGKELNVSFPNHSIELAQWQDILKQCESKIKDMQNRPKSNNKDDDLHFYSSAAVQFWYFKDAWRVRVAHARAIYDESEATKILDYTVSFFEALSPRLRED